MAGIAVPKLHIWMDGLRYSSFAKAWTRHIVFSKGVACCSRIWSCEYVQSKTAELLWYFMLACTFKILQTSCSQIPRMHELHSFLCFARSILRHGSLARVARHTDMNHGQHWTTWQIDNWHGTCILCAGLLSANGIIQRSFFQRILAKWRWSCPCAARLELTSRWEFSIVLISSFQSSFQPLPAASYDRPM